MSDELLVERDGPVLRVTFNRPAQRNALTWRMYADLANACEIADTDADVRVMVLRGAGDEAFVAGTDISQFTEFRTGEEGIAYEHKIGQVADRLASVRVPTVAVVSGFCVGAGFALAAVCDLRVATRSARFGIPVARTLGNCLAMSTYALIVGHLGQARALDMLLRARLFTGEEMHAIGFVAQLCEEAELDACTTSVVDQLAANAPLTMWAAKEATRRLRQANLPDGDDIVRTVYGSADFRLGVASFLAKQQPRWQCR
ncbi:MAG TPA: enoyl-CoA hydratase/isomerase family protein [Pseudonocardiaceae bacterium]|nr:enoyl-CoA hydratase/isomerase family protein [Pseudonocardiaceae bacterium]